MDFSFDEVQNDLADLADRIIADASDPGALRALETSGAPRLDRALWATLAEAGVVGIGVPESNGGAGLGLIEIGLVLDRAARHAAAVPLWETMALGAWPLARFGRGGAGSGVADGWLTRVAAGEAILTAAWSDEMGDDPLEPLVRAEGAGEHGASVRLSGLKICVPAGQVADGVVVSATSDSGPVLVIVDTSAEGVTSEALVTTNLSPDATFTFDDAEGTVIAIGREALDLAFQVATATQCAVGLGNAETALSLTADYTKERKQFDVPIATFQAVGHRAADAYVDTEAIRLTTWQALWRLAEGLDAGEQVAIAKFWVAWGGQRVAHAAAHLHGGVGVDRDYPLHRYFLTAKQVELQLGGTTASLRRLGALIAADATA